jgi:NAD(P)-dependent dehydrogenase (short-subunit alcohol dehydrogenase family)
MDKSISGKRVIVTAGAAGIGRRIAERFAEQGAQVHICDVGEGALAAFRTANPTIGTTLADVADEAAVDRLFDDAKKSLGGLDVLVNNAGIAGPTAKIEEIAPSDWNRTIAINITGQFLCARRAVPLLKAQGGGSIINLSSVAGRLGFKMRTPYSASKWAVVGFTQSLAIETGPDNIRVNAILPGVVEGERINRVISAKAEAMGISFEEMRDELLEMVSLRRMVTADDIANMALYLVSDAGRNISGQPLSVCGHVQALI